MERISEFIQSFNNILNKALSPEDVFKIELSYMLQAPDYDAFITLYDIALNEKIRIDLLALQEKPSFIALIPNSAIEKFQYDRFNSKQIDDIYNFFEEQLESLCVQWEDYANNIIYKTQAFFHGKPKGIPHGLIECMQCIKKANIYSASTNNAEIPRMEEKISHMLYLISEDNINTELQRIKNYRKESHDSTLFLKREFYLQHCKIANSFVSKNNIQLPYIYVLAYNIMRLSQNPLRSICAPSNEALVSDTQKYMLKLQDIYKNIMIHKPGLDQALDYTVSLDLANPDPKTSLITTTFPLPFDLVLPTFVSWKNQAKYKSTTRIKASPLNNDFPSVTNVAHPFILTKLPCTYIPCGINDIEYFFKSFCKIDSKESSFSANTTIDPPDAQNDLSNKFLSSIERHKSGKVEQKKKETKRNNIKTKIEILKETNPERLDLYNRLETNIDKINLEFDDFIKFYCKESSYCNLNNFFRKKHVSKTNYQRYVQDDTPSRKKEYILSLLIQLKYDLNLSFEDFEFAFAYAGYTLSNGNYRDIAIKEILKDSVSTIEDMNKILQRLGLKPIQHTSSKNIL